MAWVKQSTETAETDNAHLRLSFYRQAGETVAVLEITNTDRSVPPPAEFTLAQALAAGAITQGEHDAFLPFAAKLRNFGLSLRGYVQQ